MAAIRILVTVFCCIYLLSDVGTNSSEDYDWIYYAIPGNASEMYPECSDNFCAPFDFYMFYASKVFISSTKLVVIPGVHVVKQRSTITIGDAERLCITGTSLVKDRSVTVDHATLHIPQPESVIQCSEREKFGIAFFNVSKLTITNLTITGCGGWLNIIFFQDAAPAILGSTIVATLFLLNVRDVHIDTVSVQNTTVGHGLLAINVLGNSTIENTSFLWNSQTSIEYLLHPNAKFTGGNALFLFTDSADCTPSQHPHTFSIITTWFIGGTKEVVLMDNWHSPALQGGSGLNIMIASCMLNLNITVHDVVAGKNLAHTSSGINLWIGVFMLSRNFTITITRAELLNPLSPVPYNPTLGVTYNLEIPQGSFFGTHTCDCSHFMSNSSKVIFSDVDISNNRHNMAILLEEAHVSSGGNHSLSLNQCTVSDHSVFLVTPSALSVVQQGAQTNVEIELSNCNFQRIESSGQGRATILARNSKMVLNNCTFSDNLDTALHITGQSNITFKGEIIFYNNTGLYGGAILVDGYQAYVFLTPHTHVQFIENAALATGGAIHVSSRQNNGMLDSDTPTYCFLQIDCSESTSCFGVNFANLTQVQISLDLQIRFVNNTAAKAGSTIWGGSVEDCVLILTPFSSHQAHLMDLFQIEHSSLDKSSIASPPQGICYCSDSNACTSEDESFLLLVNETITTFPGQVVTISVGVIGQMNGFVPALIQAYPSTGSGLVLQQFQQTQRIAQAECTTISFALYAQMNPDPGVDNNYLVLSTAVDGTDYPLDYYEQAYMQLQHFISIPVIFKQCPVGFQYSPMSKSCACLQPLLKFLQNISCDINTQTVQKTAAVWIDSFYTTNQTQILAVHRHCPFDYCRPSSHKLDLSHPDHQCAHNRSGVLCGGCKTGLSLTLGSTRCRECSHSFLSLLIVFTAAGIALVAVLTCLNLTVSVGTINGLIFYANIIRALHPVFFPTTNFLSVFIAWINLDIGINTCFYDGMDFYVLTWLQFLFPMYIWLIVAIMIITSHYSTTVARLVSRDAVKVLATLFLLSYAKLLKTVITVLSFTYITYEGTNGVFYKSAVWVYDGNVRFLKERHLPLFMVAVVFGLFYIIPFTLLLLMAPLLQSKSHQYRALQWVNRIMPFLDAYQGPYNKKYRFWSGLLLSVRVILFVAFAMNILGDSQVNLMLIATCLTGLLSLQWLLAAVYKFGAIYQDVLVNYLEIFYLLNITVLSIWSLIQMDSATSTIKTQIAISNVCVGLAFVVFVLILTYHAYVQVKAYTCFKKLPKFIRAKQPKAKDSVDPVSSRNEREQVTTVQNVEVPRTVIELREPLLTEN